MTRFRGSGWRVLVAMVTVTAAAVACSGPSSTPQATVGAFLTAWNQGDWTAMAAYVDRPSPGFATSGPAITAGLGAKAATHTAVTVIPHGSTATATISSTYQLPEVGPWPVRSTVALVRHSGKWLVDWSPTVVYPGLAPGQRLVLDPTWAPRAPILGAGGAALTTQQQQVIVGLEGSRIKNDAAVTAVLRAAGATAAETSAALSAAKARPTYFEPVFQLTEARYDQLGGDASTLHQIPGTVFQHVSVRAAITPGLAAHVVGSVGPITAEEVQQLGPPYDAGNTVGQTGLEAAYEKQLAGTPGATIAVEGKAGQQQQTVATFQPKAGAAVQTSIDPTVQPAAEAALTGVTQNAALVAVRASTGQILASVSVPATDQFDQALDGEFPPGSTFKVLTATALIEHGLSPGSPASCPPSVTVDGEVFHNAEGDAPVTSMQSAFTESCNTAFVQLATANLQASSFTQVAALYGIGTAPQMGLTAFAGSVPAPKDGAALAATAIGQASVVVSPLNLALVAAAVDSGTVHRARLVVGAPDDTAPTRPVPAGVLAALRPMMAAVVSSGTAAGTGLPPGTYAKTGTAQYGSGNPLPTDAWLMGYDGDLAFAMVVHDSPGNGGPVVGPIVARFLRALPAAAVSGL